MPLLPKCLPPTSKASIISLNPKSRSFGCPLTIEPNQFSLFMKFCRSIILPTILFIIFPICSMLGSCTKVLYRVLSQLLRLLNYTIICPIVHKCCICVQLWEIIHIPCMKSSISTLQCCTSCYSIMSYATLILYYYASMLTLQNFVRSRVLWLSQLWY